jgi:hypothetical protein
LLQANLHSLSEARWQDARMAVEARRADCMSRTANLDVPPGALNGIAIAPRINSEQKPSIQNIRKVLTWDFQRHVDLGDT